MKIRNRAVSLMSTAALLGGTLVGLTASSASAAGDCNTYTIVVNNSAGSGKLRWNAPLRPMPYEACGSHGTFAKGSKIWYWCYEYNNYGNMWIFGRLDGTQTKGWIYAPNVAPVADVNPCY